MTFNELAMKALQTTDAEAAHEALWSHTPFPFDPTPRVLFKKLDGFRRASKNGIRLCELCDRRADGDKWTCRQCDDALSNAR